MTGAEAAIATLQTHGVDTVFGIPGVHTLPLYEAMRLAGRGGRPFRHVLARHEQGAGFMADGYARASGRPGVVCTITGPGVTNVATPMASAYADSIPVLVVSTSLPRASTGRPRGELHELKDQLGVMESLAGWTRAVETVDEIPDAVRDAFHALRSGRPRGAYLQIPLDLLEMEAQVEIPAPASVTLSAPDEAAIAAAAKLLSAAERPLIVAGAGVTMAGANAQLARLAERLGAPVLLGSKSRDVLPSDFPLAIATTGYGLPSRLLQMVRESDAVLVVGSKLGAERTGQGKLPLVPQLIHVDVDPAEIGRQYPATIGIVADARLALEALLGALDDDKGPRASRADEVAAAREALHAGVRRSFGAPVALLDAVRAALPAEGILVADMTMPGYASAEYFPVFGPRTYMHPSELCTIGCALPMALGAKVAAPGRPVVALCGDGGFLLNTGELATAVQECLGVVAIVFNDATYTAVKSDQQQRFAGEYMATDLVAPDFVALAGAFGADGVRAEGGDALREALSAALAAERPALIEVPLPPREW
jgi:acetolactate synthase-1/2/3 large subunit